MNVVLIGPSGAGKGTQAENLATKFGLRHVATGDLFREDLINQTPLGMLVKKYIERGELVPDEVADAVIQANLCQTDPVQGVILDGYPRTQYQAQMLDELFVELGRTLDAAIYLNVSDEEIITNRIPGRITCKKCQRPFHKSANPFTSCPDGVCQGEHLYRREDDTSEHTSVRLKVFHRQIAPVVDYYQKTGRLIVLDGEGSIDHVTTVLTGAMEALAKREALRATREQSHQIQALKQVAPALSPDQATERSLDIVLLGAPGSGKGTQAQHLCLELQLPHIATGNLFRENLKNQTELGRLAKSFMDRGELVPDGVTEAMVRERLSQTDTKGGFILDGFPRTLPQAEALTDMMNSLKRRIDGVIYLKVSDEEIVKRLSGRWICHECQIPFHQIYQPFVSCPSGKCQGEHLYQRDDDKPETVRSRLKAFYRQTAPLIDYYAQAGLLIEVNGEGDVTEISQRMLAATQTLLRQSPLP